jgi:hypothetical protein
LTCSSAAIGKLACTDPADGYYLDNVDVVIAESGSKGSQKRSNAGTVVLGILFGFAVVGFAWLYDKQNRNVEALRVEVRQERCRANTVQMEANPLARGRVQPGYAPNASTDDDVYENEPSQAGGYLAVSRTAAPSATNAAPKLDEDNYVMDQRHQISETVYSVPAEAENYSGLTDSHTAYSSTTTITSSA